jgi:hypothetical protein
MRGVGLTVTEDDIPSGWDLQSIDCSASTGVTATTDTENAPHVTSKTVSVTTESTCGDGNEAGVSFSNTPLTDITVSVDSQVDGTASTITCSPDSASTEPNGDGSLKLSDKDPGTYDHTIVVDP